MKATLEVGFGAIFVHDLHNVTNSSKALSPRKNRGNNLAAARHRTIINNLPSLLYGRVGSGKECGSNVERAIICVVNRNSMAA
jgi:hypothetical protein